MLDYFVKLATALIPPAEGSAPEVIRRWRITVSAALIGSLAMQTIHIAIACGYFAFMGIPGFVQAKDLEPLRNSIAAVRTAQGHDVGEVKARLVSIEANQRNNAIRQIDTAIREDAARLCRAQTDDAKQYFTQQIHLELLDWAAYTSQAYLVPTCDQLLTKSQ